MCVCVYIAEIIIIKKLGMQNKTKEVHRPNTSMSMKSWAEI